MVLHVNQKPVVVVNTGATAKTTALPVDNSWNKDGIEIYNADPTNTLFVKMAPTAAELAASPADATCQWIAPNTSKTFRRDPYSLFISTVLSGAGVTNAYLNPNSGFPTSMS